MPLNPLVITLMVFATLIGVIIKAAAKISSYEGIRLENVPLWGALCETIFLILATMMWVIMFSGIL